MFLKPCHLQTLLSALKFALNRIQHVKWSTKHFFDLLVLLLRVLRALTLPCLLEHNSLHMEWLAGCREGTGFLCSMQVLGGWKKLKISRTGPCLTYFMLTSMYVLYKCSQRLVSRSMPVVKNELFLAAVHRTVYDLDISCVSRIGLTIFHLQISEIILNINRFSISKHKLFQRKLLYILK